VGAGVGVSDGVGLGSVAVGLGSGSGLALGSGVGVGEVDGVAATCTGAAGLAAPEGGRASSEATVRADVMGPKPAAFDRADPLCAAEPGAPDAACSPDLCGLGEAFETRMMCGRVRVPVWVRCCARRA
jgi:hypothetical protein